MLRISLPLNPVVEFVRQRLPNLPFHFSEFLDATIVGHEQVIVLERVTIGFRHFTDTGGANMGNQAFRFDLGSHTAQVAIAPCGVNGNEIDGLHIHLWHIPAHTKTVAVEGLFDFPGMKTLVDQRILGFVEQIIKENRRSLVRKQSAHRSVASG